MAIGTGTHLLCLHKALDPKLIKAIEQDVVPHLQHLGVVPEAAPDLTRPDAGVPALTLVFDREGWSPDLFKRLARRGIACITWHKNFTGEDWPQEDFRTLEVPIHRPAGTSATTVDLAEQPIAADALGPGCRRHVLALVAGELLQVYARAVQPRLPAQP